MRWVALFLLVSTAQIWPALSSAATQKAPAPSVIFVYVDDASITSSDKVTLNRARYAEVIRQVRAAGAAFAVLKFQMDKIEDGTEALRRAMYTLPVLMQASIQNSPTDTSLDDLVHRSVLIPGWEGVAHPLAAPYVGLPIKPLARAAAGVGIADGRLTPGHDRIETFLLVGKSTVIPSLQLLTAEKILRSKSRIAGKRLVIGNREFDIDAEGRAFCPLYPIMPVQMYPLSMFRTIKFLPGQLKDTAVIIGYQRADTPRIAINDTLSLPIHEYFFRQVLCLINPQV